MSRTFFTGANACVKLKQFEEAVIWCDRGLTVSFLRRIQISQYNIITSFTSKRTVQSSLMSFNKQSRVDLNKLPVGEGF